MENIPDLALEEAVLKTLGKAVDNELKRVRPRLEEVMAATGVTRIDARLPDGTKIATISGPSPETEAVVTNERAFLEWVRQNRPSEILEQVRPSYQTALLAEMTKAGKPVWIDRGNGEIHEVPGVSMEQRMKGSHTVRTAAGSREAVAEAWRSGELNHLNLPQLVGRSAGESA